MLPAYRLYRAAVNGAATRATGISNRDTRGINAHLHRPGSSLAHRLRPCRCHRHQPPARRGRPLHQHDITIFIDFSPSEDADCLDTPSFDCINIGAVIFINSSSGENVIYIGATGRLHRHDVAIFVDLLPSEDVVDIGTPPFFYIKSLHRAKVVPATTTP